jgi:hypothetical protein
MTHPIEGHWPWCDVEPTPRGGDPSAIESFAVGDHVRTHQHAGGADGVVEKIGRRWITVRWTQSNGAVWTKQHLPEWLVRVD